MLGFRDSWNVWREKVNKALGTVEEIDADEVVYDNTDSGLTATNVQSAIDEVVGDIDDLDGGDIAYDGTDSGLIATNVQGAIDEVAAVTTAVHGNYVSKGTFDIRVDKVDTDTWGALLDKLCTKAVTEIQALADDERVQILGITGSVNLVTAYPSSFLSNSLTTLTTYLLGSGAITNGHTLTSVTLRSSGSQMITSTLLSTTQTFGSDRSAVEAGASSYLVLRLHLFKKV